MIRSGILTDGDPVELLEGWLVVKMSKNPPHSTATRLLRRALERLTPTGWFVDTQEPITTLDSEPEPDLVVVRGEERQFLERHPSPEDLALVVEVSDTSLERDQTTKQRLYARSRVPVYWIANLPESRIEVYTGPSGPVEEPGYSQRQDFALTDEVPLTIDGREVGRLSVRQLLP
jgi:hypothetical protein